MSGWTQTLSIVCRWVEPGAIMQPTRRFSVHCGLLFEKQNLMNLKLLIFAMRDNSPPNLSEKLLQPDLFKNMY